MSKRKAVSTGSASKKRRGAVGAIVVVPKARRYPRGRAFRAGYDRTGGYYGRFGTKSGTEKKFLDTAISGTIPTAPAIPTGGQICLVADGDDAFNRDGRQIVIKSISARINLTYVPAAQATTACLATLLLVLDTQANGTAAAPTDVVIGSFENTFNVLANNQRFKILYRKVIRFEPMAGVSTAYNNIVHHIEMYKKCNYTISYSGTTGVVGEIKSNNIFWMWCVNIAGANNLITGAGTTRIRFVG